MTQRLYKPTTLDRHNKVNLKNRIVMAPMTRCRAVNNIPSPMMKTYYEQRSEAGLIITEGTSPSQNGLGYARIPGIFSQEQVAGWKEITSGVKKRGTKIYLQVMHTGRVSHPENMSKTARILAPSAVACPGNMYTDSKGMQDYPTPSPMTESDIASTISEYGHAAKLAMQAGFDGIELHGANGYLIDQFLNTASNHRKDKWGGSIENRIRFGVAVTQAVVKEIGAEHVGMRISPYGAFSGMIADPDMDKIYEHLCVELEKLKINYIHVVDHSSMGPPPVKQELKNQIRSLFRGRYILSGGYDAARAEADLAENRGDLVAFGRPFIANPTLLSKMQKGQALTPPDPATFYTPGEKGYTDYL
ncbi:MAG: alkene reductase [Oligoflexales bacterium]|nr:alkene reductase [Oligoflexales bacterium]